MKKILVAFFVFCLLSNISISGLAGVNAELYPTDDSWVDINDSSINKNGTGLRADYSYLPDCTPTRLVYLRFDLTTQVADLSPISKLRIYLSDPPLAGETISLWSTGDDWNGAEVGSGDQTTLTADNAPSSIGLLDSQSVGTSSAWVELSGTALSNYINSQKSSHGGDDLVSFVIQWESCPLGYLADTMRFEDLENSLGTGYMPHIYPEPLYALFFPIVLSTTP